MQTMKYLLPFLKVGGETGENPYTRLSELYFWKYKVQGCVHNPKVQDNLFQMMQK